MKNTRLLGLIILCIFSLCSSPLPLVKLIRTADNALQVTTLYGTASVRTPILVSLMTHPAFNRLNNINQYGLVHYIPGEPHYTRYEHSLGVWFLTAQYKAPIQEQVAALLHDVSHTVFSHVGDAYFKSDYRTGKDSYQDTIHEWYLEQVGIMPLLKRYGCGDACSASQKVNQRCYDQSLPGLCADRIEYNLAGGYIDGLITKEDIERILASLTFEDGQWFFDNQKTAKEFGLLSIKLSENRWGGARCAFIDRCGAAALRRACKLEIITEEDIHFSTDDVVWHKFIDSSDLAIKTLVAAILKSREAFDACATAPLKEDLHVVGKFSGTDPLVATHEGLQRLSALDDEYRKEYARVKTLVRGGWYLTLKEPFRGLLGTEN